MELILSPTDQKRNTAKAINYDVKTFSPEDSIHVGQILCPH